MRDVHPGKRERVSLFLAAKPDTFKAGVGRGYSHLIHHDVLKNSSTGFYENETFNLTVEAKIQDPLDNVLHSFADSMNLGSTKGSHGGVATSNILAGKASCIVCWDKPQTAGFAHDGEYVAWF